MDCSGSLHCLELRSGVRPWAAHPELKGSEQGMGCACAVPRQEKHFQCSLGAERTLTQGKLSTGWKIHNKGNSSTWIPDEKKHLPSFTLKSLSASPATFVQVRCTILCTWKREPTQSQMWTYTTSGSEDYQIPRWQLVLWLQLLQEGTDV